MNCVLGQDTEIGILKRHIMHVSHKPYELVSCNMLWTEIMWGRAWLLTLLNGCRGESILLMPIRRKKLSARWSFKVSRVCEIQARCQSPQSRRKLSFDESEKKFYPETANHRRSAERLRVASHRRIRHRRSQKTLNGKTDAVRESKNSQTRHQTTT